MHKVTFILLVIGGLNWLLEVFNVGLGDWSMSDGWGLFMKVVYVLVGLSAIYEVVTHAKNCKMCEKKNMSAQPMAK
ncbi:MAG: DUF378 domain-containing protein [Patescibacteria group bacterium]